MYVDIFKKIIILNLSASARSSVHSSVDSCQHMYYNYKMKIKLLLKKPRKMENTYYQNKTRTIFMVILSFYKGIDFTQITQVFDILC